MKKGKNKKIVLAATIGFISIACLLAMIFIARVFLKKYACPETEGPITAVGIKPVDSGEPEDDWNTYADGQFGYELQYPSRLNVRSEGKKTMIIDENTQGDKRSPSGGTLFFADDGYVLISVRVFEGRDFSSAREWLADRNERLAGTGLKLVVERSIDLDGNELIITRTENSRGNEPGYEREKESAVVRDGLLYEVSARYIDHDKFWDSFRFAE